MRSAVAGLVLGLALAAGVPAAWALTRPPATAGQPVAAVLAAPDAGAAPHPTAVTPRSGAARPAPESPPPVRLRVPGLGLDAPVDAVGVAPDGQMALPDDVRRVGWYRFGSAPGMPGSAVLAGHVDDREQGLGALARLGEASVGQDVVVTDAGGGGTRWRVVSRALLDKGSLPVTELFRRDGPPRLTLVTCGGRFLADVGSYAGNVVVVAEQAE